MIEIVRSKEDLDRIKKLTRVKVIEKSKLKEVVIDVLKNELNITKSIKEINKEIILNTEKYIDERIFQMFKTEEFMEGFRQRMFKFMEDEVRVQIKDANLHNYVKNILQQYIDYHLKDLIKEIIDSIVKDINKKYRRDYQTAKELSYSIDTTIKHALLKAPNSMEKDENFWRTIQKDMESKKIKLEKKDIKRLVYKKEE